MPSPINPRPETSASAHPLEAAAVGRGAGRRRFWRDSKGGVLVTYGLALPALLGFVGVGAETGTWYVAKRDLQTQADAAAIAAAWQVAYEQDDQVIPVALGEAVRNGFEDTDETDYTVLNPPTSGPNAGNTNAVEVILRERHNALFSVLVDAEGASIASRAVAEIDSSGEACALALNPSVESAMKNTGNSDLNSPSCTLAANSKAHNAVNFGGSATINIESVWSAGGFVDTTNATLGKPAKTNMWPIDDPYADVDPTPPAGCDINAKQNLNGAMTYDPGGDGKMTFCKDISITNGAAVDFKPGTYYIKDADLSIQGGTVTCSLCETGGDGVTFVFTAKDPASTSNIGSISINGGASVTLNAPSAGDYKGLLFFQDQAAPKASNNKASLNGGADTVLNGAIYFPNNEVQWAGNVGLTAACTLIVADTVNFTGDSGLAVNDCANQGVDIAFVRRILLSE